MYDTISIEELNKPAIGLVHKDFALDARSAASSVGVPGIRVVSETVPCEASVMEQIEAGVSAAMDDIIAALTKPLTAEEKSPKKQTEQLPRIVFKGNLEEVNRFFYKRGWTDGLPIVPPTEEAVAEMLTGTDLPADHLVTKIIPRLGKATVEKIAINAVMAGALPTYMPLLIAGVQALMSETARLGAFEVSTGSWAPFWIVNGPIRHDLNINCSTGAMTPGNIANATIGRAMGLIVKNIGGARAGIEDMGQLGNPGKYTMVMAENEEESPWEPLHVEQGVNKEDSAISLFFPNCYVQLMSYGTDDKGILSTAVYNIIPGTRGLFCFVVPPSHARALADRGWTKKEIAAFISENAMLPYYRNWEYWDAPKVPERWRKPINPADSMRLLRNPEWIRVLVAGGPGNHVGLLTGGGSNVKGEAAGGADWTTVKVELPANWDKLVAKYKNIVPTHVLY